MSFFKGLLGVGALTVATLVHASPVNLLTNGSFETGLTGWLTSGTQISFTPAVVVTDGSSACCFGEAVPASNVASASTDAVGTHGVYFVDDRASQRLLQSVFLTAGSYEIGFDAYVPFNGFSNPGDARFTGSIAGVTLADFSVKNGANPGEWVNYSGVADVLSAGIYNVAFTFNTFGGASADVVIDRAFILASGGTGGTPIGEVPEPSSMTLSAAALALLGFFSWRRRRG